MKSTIIALAVISVSLIAAETRSVPSVPSDLTVHEWGTFTSVAGENGSAVDWDALGCKNDLPRFVNDFGYRGFKSRVTGTVRMETPVVYFYSAQEMEAALKVSFPYGVITESYPRGDYGIYQTTALTGPAHELNAKPVGINTSLRNVTGGIEWKHIRIQPNASFALPIEAEQSRYYAARSTDAASITVNGEHEKFIFYRGVARFSVPLSARVSDAGVALIEHRTGKTVRVVIYFENRGGRLGYRTALDIKRTAALDPPSFHQSGPAKAGHHRELTELRRDLETALIGQGLFPKEAHAMVETWKDSWFEEGARLIYIVPSRSVDVILPLQVEPAPAETTRVFVGRIELVTPETMRVVERGIAANDRAIIDRYGRFLDPILRRIEYSNPKTANQIQQLRRTMSSQQCS